MHTYEDTLNTFVTKCKELLIFKESEMYFKIRGKKEKGVKRAIRYGKEESGK